MIKIEGPHQVVNTQLNELPKDTKTLSVTCEDREVVDLCHCLLEKDIQLERLSLKHVNLIPKERQDSSTIVPKPRGGNKRRISAFTMGRPYEPDEEQKKEKETQELELYKSVFVKWSGLTHLEMVDGSGVLTDPIHFIKSLPITMPLLQSLKLVKSMPENHAIDDALSVLDNETMSALCDLDSLRVLHLLGFAGRQNRYQRYLFTHLDNAVENLASKGLLEEFHFSQSGITYKGIFSLIKHCKDLRELKVWSRFGEPGLFMLHHNLPFLKIGDHHLNSAVYEPESEDSPRQLIMTLTNVMLDQSRYDPAWMNDTYPEEKLSVNDLVR